MQALLHRIEQRLDQHLSYDPQRPPLGDMGVFHCRSRQVIRNVPIHSATAILVISGRKSMMQAGAAISVAAGELLLLPAGSNVEIGNHPGSHGRDYLALAMGFSLSAIEQFRRNYGSAELSSAGPCWSATAPEQMVATVAQWLEGPRQPPLDPMIQTHRQVEILITLASAGIAGNLLLDRHGALASRVAQVLALDPGRAWTSADVAQRLHLGESTLRRRLQAEGSSFRQLLEEARMVAALALLQDTFWPVGQVAEAVGYQSHSRFSARFKQRFGLSPNALKQSRTSVAAQVESVTG